MFVPVFHVSPVVRRYVEASVVSYRSNGRTKREAHENLKKLVKEFNPEVYNQVQWIPEDSSFFKR